MHGAETVRGTRRAAAVVPAVLMALLLALCGAVQFAGARSAQSAGAGAGEASPVARTAMAAPYAAGPEVPYAAEAVRYAAASAADRALPASASASTPASTDADPQHCHRSKGGGGALPAAPVGSRQLLSLALPACLTPQSHSAIGAAHARPPVRGPAPIPPPTPVELSVLRV
ncbi:hypothetical protein [Streptomyces sp. AA1529]|uniref:hypothetical protein n=1 Tax=Streptomyces sp. AA1529 TaxID=1203257 RepID=UPI0002D75E02|nr:hypothetical protein [Streptomyces sp. AA1529]